MLLRVIHEKEKKYLPFVASRDDKERVSSIDEQRIEGALGLALFFFPFLSASSNPLVQNFFVRIELLVELGICILLYLYSSDFVCRILVRISRCDIFGRSISYVH